MSTTPPPIPIRGNRLTITEKMLRSRLFQGGITGSISSDLTALCSALKALEGQSPQMRIQAMALAKAFNTWLRGNHPGELSILQTSQEFLAIQAFVASYSVPNAPMTPPSAPSGPSWLKSIGVALYSVTNSNHNFKFSLDARLKNMRDAVNAFNNWLDTVNQAELQLDNPFRGIFIAPEYFFTKPSLTGEREFLDLASKNFLDTSLKQLSQAFPKILLVPGTIHYDVELSKEDKVQAGYQLLQAAKNRIFREKALAQPRTVLEGTMHHQATGPFSKVPSMNELATSLLNSNTKPRKIHNVTSLLLNGQAWGTYDKHTDFYEAKSVSPDLSMFVPGTQDECPEIGNSVRKFRFGMEICFDHGNGVLKRRAPANLHFHIVVSDSVPNNPANMAMKNGGYFLHASTDRSKTVIFHRHENGQLANETQTLWKKSFSSGPSILDLFLIKLPVPLAPPRPPRP